MTHRCYEHSSKMIDGRYYQTVFYFSGDYELIRTTDFFTMKYTDELKPNDRPIEEFTEQIRSYNQLHRQKGLNSV